jgi:hypothetical protein
MFITFLYPGQVFLRVKSKDFDGSLFLRVRTRKQSKPASLMSGGGFRIYFILNHRC